MANAKKIMTFDADINSIYKVITDYASYPEYMDGVSGLDILESDDNGARAKYHLNLIKKFSYILKMKHNAPNGLSWEFESGDIFKVNSGSWELKDLGNGKTEVTYNIEVEAKVFAPKMIVNKLVEVNLPTMMKAVEKRAQSLL